MKAVARRAEKGDASTSLRSRTDSDVKRVQFKSVPRATINARTIFDATSQRDEKETTRFRRRDDDALRLPRSLHIPYGVHAVD